LEASATRITASDANRADDARIMYTTTDPVVVAALYQWCAAQAMEHGLPRQAPVADTPRVALHTGRICRARIGVATRRCSESERWYA